MLNYFQIKWFILNNEILIFKCSYLNLHMQQTSRRLQYLSTGRSWINKL